MDAVSDQPLPADLPVSGGMSQSDDLSELPELTAEETDRYSWQFGVRDFGIAGQRRLKAARVLISRGGGVGGSVALNLAAAGIGTIVLAHGGPLRRNDLNRQLLMSTPDLGRPRIDAATERVQALNPNVRMQTVDSNVNEQNVAELVAQCDVVVGAAPLFPERFLLNREAMRQAKPLVDAAMYELEARLFTCLPGQSACLSCLYPDTPPAWKREFPVFSAVSCAIGSLAAMEVIKLLTGVGKLHPGRLLICDLAEMSFQSILIARRTDCPVCGTHAASTGTAAE